MLITATQYAEHMGVGNPAVRSLIRKGRSLRYVTAVHKPGGFAYTLEVPDDFFENKKPSGTR